MQEIYNIDTCDIYITQKILKNKWVVLIVHALFASNKSFNELINCILYISNTQLSKSLSTLKKENIISIDNDLKYFLTQKGNDLYYLTKQMQQWIQKHS